MPHRTHRLYAAEQSLVLRVVVVAAPHADRRIDHPGPPHVAVLVGQARGRVPAAAVPVAERWPFTRFSDRLARRGYESEHDRPYAIDLERVADAVEQPRRGTGARCGGVGVRRFR